VSRVLSYFISTSIGHPIFVNWDVKDLNKSIPQGM
jgi:hypothetical protein